MKHLEKKSIDPKKYSEITEEIERFIELKKKEPKTFKGIVDDIDFDNNVLTINLQSINKPNLSRGSLILLKEDSPLGTKVRATTIDSTHSNLKIEIKTNPFQFEDKKVIIDIEKTNVVLKRLEEVVEKIKKGKISLENKRILDLMIKKRNPKYIKKKIYTIPKKFNREQRKGVIKSIEAEDFHLIIGPPGTGKTYVVEELIRQFKKTTNKILVTAWTNLAVDNIIKRLSKNETRNIVRIGPINEIDSKVKKFSIFEKMKEHEDWKKVEKYIRDIEELSKSIPKINDEIISTQKNISICRKKIKIFNEELNDYVNERQKYREKIPIPPHTRNPTNIPFINNKMALISGKAEVYFSLCKDIFEIDELHKKIPKPEVIENLKKDIKNMRFSILKKRLSSFLPNTNKLEFEQLKEKYTENKEDLKEILRFIVRYNDLRKKGKKEFELVYSAKKGSPDEDVLNSEFEVYRIMEDEYLPNLKKQELFNIEIRKSEADKEVNRIYLDLLNRKIDLLNVEIMGSRTELHTQINNEENLLRQCENLRLSKEYYKKHIEKLKKIIISDIISNADLIATTAISSCHYYLDDTDFDVMIMDEASQVSSFMSLLPLLKCKKFILVGDNRQLQPIEEANISKEMNLSIFNRLLEIYPKSSTFLSTQHRMHKSIAQIASEIFYEGKLKTSKKIAERILNLKISKNQFLNPKKPVMFIDTSKAEYYEDEVGSGCSNTKEAEYVVSIIKLFIKEKVKAKDIGIVTPYVKQKVLIDEFFKKMNIKGIEVNTVHKFQGREKDIILMSFARSKKYSFQPYKLKFIENKNLVNVAITRAKKKLILIGNSQTLSQSKLLNEVINKIGKSNTVVL